MRKLFIAAAATAMLLLVGGCEGTSTASPALAVTDSAGVTIVINDVAQLSARCAISAEPTWVIGSATGPEEYELYRVFGARRLSDGRIALVNQGTQQLRFYDGNGRFIGAVGREGDGPGEFRQAFNLWVLPGDTIWVGDSPPWVYEVFTGDGTWVRSVQPTPTYSGSPAVLGMLQDGRAVLAAQVFINAPMNAFETQYLTLLVHHPDGTLADTVGRFPGGKYGRFPEYRSFVAQPYFDSTTRVSTSGSQIVVGHTSRPELSVYRSDEAGRAAIDRIVRWTAEVRPVTNADVEAERNRIRESGVEMEESLRRQLIDPQIDPRRPAAASFPVFAALASARDERIWVRGSRRPGMDGDDEWLVFDREGVLQCRASLPRFDQITEIGADYVIALIRDELAGEQVRRYELSSPEPDPPN